MTNDHNLDDLRAAITASRDSIALDMLKNETVPNMTEMHSEAEITNEAYRTADEIIASRLADINQYQPCYLTYTATRIPAWLMTKTQTIEGIQMAEFMLTRAQDPARFEGMADVYTLAYGWCPVDQLTAAEVE